MEVKLKVCVGASAGKELTVAGPKFFIGRAEDCQLRPKSDLISRHHCVLMVDDSALTVRDLGSRNGTLVNDEQVAGERELLAGDRLKVGPLEFEVVISRTLAPAQKRPKVTSVLEAAVRTAAGHPGAQNDVTQWLGSTGGANGGTTQFSGGHDTEAAETEEIKMGSTMINIPAPPMPAHTTLTPAPLAPQVPPAPAAPIVASAPAPMAAPPVAPAPPVAQAPPATPPIVADEPTPVQTASTMLNIDFEPEAKPKTAPVATSHVERYVPEHQAPPPAEPEKKTSDSKIGKLPTKPRTADSRAAAADTLKKFFNRR
jgi:pSer/pThr/pTyr-binding forkhead associated (FHA) protein